MLKEQKPQQVQVDDAHCFSGLDGYRQVIEACRRGAHRLRRQVPPHVHARRGRGRQARVRGKAARHRPGRGPHVVAAACELAKKKGLSVMSGLHSRHQRGLPGNDAADSRRRDRPDRGDRRELPPRPLRTLSPPAAVQDRSRIPDGQPVPLHLALGRRRHAIAGAQRRPRHLGACKARCRSRPTGWADAPVRYGNEIYGNVFDHHSVVYQYASGVRMYAFCRTVLGCYNEYSSIILGTKGRCNLMGCRIEGETNWHYAKRGDPDGHQVEHNVLFEAIRSGKPVNAGDYMTTSTMVAVLGQITCYSGKEVTWDQAMKSDFVFLPKPEEVRLDMPPPVAFDKAVGDYPVVPGRESPRSCSRVTAPATSAATRDRRHGRSAACSCGSRTPWPCRCRQNVCGLRSTSGNQVLCTWTISRWPLRKVWQTSGRVNRTAAGWPGANGSGFSKLLRNLPRITSPRTSCW